MVCDILYSSIIVPVQQICETGPWVSLKKTDFLGENISQIYLLFVLSPSQICQATKLNSFLCSHPCL